MLCVADCIADRVWLGIPQAIEWQHVGDQIEAAFPAYVATRYAHVREGAGVLGKHTEVLSKWGHWIHRLVKCNCSNYGRGSGVGRGLGVGVALGVLKRNVQLKSTGGPHVKAPAGM